MTMSNCPHIATNSDLSWPDINARSESARCDSCAFDGANLWLCLHSKCQYTGCGESADDHSSSHSDSTRHCVTLNLTTKRVWCYTCETEVFPGRNNPPFIIRDDRTCTSSDNSPLRGRHSISQMEESESEDEADDHRRPRGLTGLQNLGNTCYMNAALQALSNCPPLTQFFIDCPGYVRTDKKPQLSKAYQKLLLELWSRRRAGYVVPSSVLQAIKIVHPMFRGYAQQDAQEFLRSFMDEIHEELKEFIPSDGEETNSDYHSNGSSTHDTTAQQQPTIDLIGSRNNSISQSEEPRLSNNQSDTEYETCDSGLSSERSSVEHSISGEEPEPVVEIREKRRFGLLGKKRRKDKSKSRSRETSVGRDETANTVSRDNTPDTRDEEKDIDEVEEAERNKILKDATNQDKQKAELKDSEVITRVGVHKPIAESTLDDATPEVIGQNIVNSSKSRQSSVRSRQSSESERFMKMGPKSAQTTNGSVKKSPLSRSIISDIFDGKLLSSVQCLTCERISATKETFQDLSLPIPSKDHLTILHTTHAGSQITKGTCGEVHLDQSWMSWMFGWMRSWFWGPVVTLQDCLSAFFSADELKGDNMYSCERCKKLRNGVKFSKVLNLPEILCVHLKRLRHEFMFSNKISTYISFPLEGLDMGPYLHKDCGSKVNMFDLMAVICHRGTAGGGHYIAYCLNTLSDRWYEYDDQCVSQVDDRVVENCEAYVLFYKKRSDDMTSLRLRAVELTDPYEESFMQFYISRQWINRFNTFAEPGPVSNHDFLCKHGGVPPHKVDYVNELVQPVTRSLWEFIHQEFGGGPAVNHLYACDVCQQELDQLNKRQKFEMDTFMKLNAQFKEEDNPPVIYAISMAWFKDWENFVRDRVSEPAGPIDNSKICFTKNGVASLRINSDYGQVSEETWRFLHNIYGGGPELVYKENNSTQDSQPASPVTSSRPSPKKPGLSDQTSPPLSSKVGEDGDGVKATLAEIAAAKV